MKELDLHYQHEKSAILRKESKSQKMHASCYCYINTKTHRTLDTGVHSYINSKSIQTGIASYRVVVTSEGRKRLMESERG